LRQLKGWRHHLIYLQHGTRIPFTELLNDWQALATSMVKDTFGALGTEPTGGTSAEFAALIKRELIKWTAVYKDANIKPD
jgi:tripartite-type tricarboxylate transporter receptor subunit TctC